MAFQARKYREELYRLRAHPDEITAEHPITPHQETHEDYVGPAYLSLIPFVLAEYFFELTAKSMISGIVFPTGYLLFWAFFFTYYRPGVLERGLVGGKGPTLAAVPAIVLGVAIWFVKVTIIELNHLLVLQWITAKPAPVPRAKARPEPRPEPRPVKQPPTPPPAGLPTEVLAALRILELGETRDWNRIHRQYRALAKKFHPDLNRDITLGGSRFMAIDSAYKALSLVKAKYFFEKKSS